MFRAADGFPLHTEVVLHVLLTKGECLFYVPFSYFFFGAFVD